MNAPPEKLIAGAGVSPECDPDLRRPQPAGNHFQLLEALFRAFDRLRLPLSHRAAKALQLTGWHHVTQQRFVKPFRPPRFNSAVTGSNKPREKELRPRREQR